MIWKEFRALVPMWLAIVVAMVAAEYGWSTRALSAPVYFIGAVALGAQAIGHEFSHRTLSMMLTHPISRTRILLVKLGVLAVLLAALAGTAAFALPFGRVDRPFIAGMLVLPCALGLFVAPW